MALTECDCVSVDSPLAISVAAIDIVTFAIAVVGFILAAIAIFKSYRNAAQDASRFEEVYHAAVNEAELLRIAFALVPDYFTTDSQEGGKEPNPQKDASDQTEAYYSSIQSGRKWFQFLEETSSHSLTLDYTIL